MLAKYNKYFSHQLIFILIASSFLVLGAINFFEDLNFQIYLVAISVILFGIPHGALDFELMSEQSLLKKYINNKVKFTFAYLSSSFLISLFWLNYPEISLSLFLLISVFHWGESDALPKKTDESNIIRYLCETTFYGSALLSLNTIFYSQDLVELYAYLSDSEFSQKIVAVSSLVVPITISVFTYLIFHYLKKGQKQKVLEISLIFITMICLKPLIAFLLYFCFFHSPKHLIDFFHYKKEKSDYLKKMLIASIISIGFLLTFNFFIDKDMIQYASSINLGLFRSVFICLAALTIPHVVLVVLWHRESRN